MSLFKRIQITDRYGVVVDVGSGSVLTAIVHSDPDLEFPQIVWAHREHAPLRNIDSLEQSAKAVMTALMNSSMLLDTEGRTALREYDKNAVLSVVQCGIAAPWSYTITKIIGYTQEDPFEITKELIAELTETIHQKIESDLKESEALKGLGLQVVARTTTDILSNGYHVTEPIGNQSCEVTLSRVSVVTQQYLIDAIDDMSSKLFPEARVKKVSFMLMLYTATRELLPNTYDACLVDVTYEATEIGIVRDGVLNYCTHAPFGSFSLAREISAITKIPLHEAFAHLHSEKPLAFIKSLTPKQAEEVETLLDSYTEKISELFQQTGDALSIPKQIILHSDLDSEPLFASLVSKAAKRAIKAEPFITPVTKELITQTFKAATTDSGTKIPLDTALLLSAQFFHKLQKPFAFEDF